MDGAMENLYRKIAAIGRRFRAERVVLFGSRARGDNRCLLYTSPSPRDCS